MLEVADNDMTNVRSRTAKCQRVCGKGYFENINQSIIELHGHVHWQGGKTKDKKMEVLPLEK